MFCHSSEFLRKDIMLQKAFKRFKNFMVPFQLSTFRFNFLKATKPLPQPAFTCSKLTIETLEQGVKFVQS